MRTAVLCIGILLGLFVVGALFAPEGEVVTLTTFDDEGAAYETALWLVERGDAYYLRANSDEAGWFTRLKTQPEVELHRGDEMLRFLARPQRASDARSQVNQAMARKYGPADRLLGLWFDPERSVPVRLEPIGDPTPAHAPGPERPGNASG